MLKHQREKFNLKEDVIYFNTSYMSPSLKTVEDAGIKALKEKSNPFNIYPKDFFNPVTELKKKYATLIDVADYNRIACIPSVSYGIATVTNNIVLKPGDEIIVVEDQFPSNFYSWEKLAEKFEAILTIIKKPTSGNEKAKVWNERIIQAISPKTTVVAMCHVHWADGTLFDLMAIRKKTKENEALLIIDGTQSVGALPFSVEQIQPDALICAAYKWLLGPYTLGFAYFGSYFDNGKPIEESWVNRINSEDFSGLTNYQNAYKPKANRYGMGESANFIEAPMAIKAIDQLLEWTPQAIQSYCYKISIDALTQLKALGFVIEDDAFRGHHLIGIEIPDFINIENLKSAFSNQNIFVSIRGNYIRVSPHLYSTKTDFDKFVHCIKSILN